MWEDVGGGKGKGKQKMLILCSPIFKIRNTVNLLGKHLRKFSE